MVVQHGYTWAGVPGTDVCGACAGKSACRGALEAPDGWAYSQLKSAHRWVRSLRRLAVDVHPVGESTCCDGRDRQLIAEVYPRTRHSACTVVRSGNNGTDP